MGVATGKSDRGLGLCLAHHGIGSRFVTLQTADRHPSKPHPAMLNAAMAEAGATPQATLMIGDTSFDMAMGCAAGARSVGVTWGYHDAHELPAIVATLKEDPAAWYKANRIPAAGRSEEHTSELQSLMRISYAV